MSDAIVLQHSPAFGAGRLIAGLSEFGIPVKIRRLFSGDEVPMDLDEIRTLIVLGGPMRVGDIETDKYPFLKKEVELLQRLIAIDRPVLAIGLGAQLLAHAAGAKVYPNARPGATKTDPPVETPELGWGPITLPFPGGTEPMVMGLADGTPMFHWHWDTFDLPKLPPPPGWASGGPPPPSGNALLCSSRLCKNQAFRFKTRLFGFQFHFEFTTTEIDSVLSADKEGVKVLGPEGEKQIRDQTAKNMPRYARMGDRIVKNFVQFTKTY